MRQVVVKGWCALIVCGALSPGVGMAQDRTADGIRVLDAHELAAAFPGLRKTIAVRFEGKPVEQALRDIAAKADLELTYSNIALPKRRTVWLTADRIRVDKALEKVLADAGLQLLPLANRRLVVVPVGGHDVAAPAGNIVGQVIDTATRRGVKDAEIYLEGARWRAETDSTGRYSLADVDTGTYMLTARRLGYAKQSRQVTVREGQTDTVDFALAAAALKLDELVTTATGQQRRRDLGNAITTINADSVMQTAPVRSLTDLLENRVPGMSLQYTSGVPGDPARIRLRGIGSILQKNDPVVVVDGVRVYAAQSDRRSGNLASANVFGTGDDNPRPAPSPLDQIDPNSIEKIEVFKGPSAATLYGADAANGVLVITTKRGRPGPTQWRIDVSHGRTNHLGRYAEGYYPWGHDIYNSADVTFCPTVNLNCELDSLVRFQALNDPDLTLLTQGQNTVASLTASGGSQALTYSLTGSFSDETGVLRMPAFEIERFRTRFNRDPDEWMQSPLRYKMWNVSSNVRALLGKTADVALTTRISKSVQTRTNLESRLADLSSTYVNPVAGLYYRPSNTNSYTLSPSATYLDAYYTKTTASTVTFVTGLEANWRPLSWANVHGNAGLDVTPRNDEIFRPSGLVAVSDSGALARGTGRSLVSTVNLRASARRPWRLGFAFEASAGVNYTQTITDDMQGSARGLVPGVRALSGARILTVEDQQSNASVFGWYVEPRLVGERLSISTGLRLDGGSSYGSRVDLLSLPKLNGSWVISEESFFPFKSLFSSLRLRAAYGQAQVQPDPDDRLRLYQFSTSGGQGLELTSLGNTQLRPERSAEIEGGFDADMLDNRVGVTLTFYRKNTIDQLAEVQLPPSVHGGRTTVLRNIGNTRNTGVEITANVTPVQSPGLTWTTGVIYSSNHNTLVKLGRGVKTSYSTGLVEGYPLYSRWAKPILGYADHNGNGVIEYREVLIGDSSVFMGRLNPDYEIGFHSTLSLFGGALDINTGISYESGATQLNNALRSSWVLVRGIADRDAPFSEQAAVIASFRSSPSDRATDYGILYDISTFRFNSLSINYRAPDRVARVFRAQQMRVAIQGSNLALHSTYGGRDPDVNTWKSGEGIADGGQLTRPKLWRLSVSLSY